MYVHMYIETKKQIKFLYLGFLLSIDQKSILKIIREFKLTDKKYLKVIKQKYLIKVKYFYVSVKLNEGNSPSNPIQEMNIFVDSVWLTNKSCANIVHVKAWSWELPSSFVFKLAGFWADPNCCVFLLIIILSYTGMPRFIAPRFTAFFYCTLQILCFFFFFYTNVWASCKLFCKLCLFSSCFCVTFL